MMPNIQNSRLLSLLALSCLGFTSLASAEIRNVIHITVDGLRGDLLQNLVNTSPATYPNFKKIKDEGATTYNARCDVDYSETIPNHSCVVTGRPVNDPAGLTGVGHKYTSNGYSGNASTGDSIHALGTAAYSYKVSTFDMAHDRGYSTAIYGGKTRLNLYLHSYNANKGRADTVGADNGKNKVDASSIGDWLVSGALGNLKNPKVALVDVINAGLLKNYTLVHFTDLDTGTSVGGHNIDWGSSAWNTGVAGVDGYLGEIFAALAASTNANINGKTAIVITADHGGGGGGSGPGATAARNHGDQAAQANFTIPVLLWGPGVPAGIEAHSLFLNRADPAAVRPATTPATTQPLRNADTANICMTFLGVPQIEGSYFKPIFKENLTVTRNSGNLTVSWPGYLTNHKLEWSPTLQAASWQSDAVVPTDAGGRYSKTLTDPGVAKLFFHLAPPP